ncbi:MarR family transcriptional regulator [Halorutilales archaeon Cl-col2-1]
MPIDIESFEEDSETELRSEGKTNSEEILSFLASNPDKAYTPKEIHEETGVARGSVGVVLSRLEERDLVRHRGEYWAVGDVEDLDKTLTSMSVSRAVTQRLGAEDPEEWGRGVESETENP